MQKSRALPQVRDKSVRNLICLEAKTYQLIREDRAFFRFDCEKTTRCNVISIPVTA